MKKPPLLLLLAAGLLFLAGCSGFNRGVTSVGLSVELTGIERAADGNVAVTWGLVNPNVSPYLLARVSQKIFLNGTLVGTTLDTEPMAAPAQQTTSKVSRLTPAGPAGERLIAEAAASLANDGIKAAVVSLPSFELFRAQSQEYRDSVLGSAPRVAVEAAVAQGWHEWLRHKDTFIGLSDFGASAPAPRLFEHFGITAAKVADAARTLAKAKS